MALVVFAGQSNTGGYRMDETTLQKAWVDDPKILIWNTTSQQWEVMHPGLNTGYGGNPHAWGPELQFALDFRAQYPDEVLRIVKVAHGGTGLDQDTGQWVYDWSPASRDELFDEVTRTIAQARAAAGNESVAAVFYGQGEEDAAYAEKAQDYAANLPALFSAIRAHWIGDASGKIGFFQINTGTPFAAQVRQAQQTVDANDPNAVSVDTVNFGLQGDLLHFNAAGHTEIGHGFFSMFQGWRSSAPSQPGQELNGTFAADTLMGGSGDDSINGGGGQDFLRGGEGHDRMAGGDAFDDMHGNQGDDTLSGGADGDWVVGGKDNDQLFGDDGDDVVLGNLGNDLVDGGAGGDVLRGGQGDDVVQGWSGNDWISGDRGTDTLSGGSGADIFHTFGEAGRDIVTDFNAAEGDRVYLLPGTQYWTFQLGADVVVGTVGGGELVLQNTQLSTLPPGWIFGV